jgi:glycosyltransferase involved in cell wall biosynthesis
MKRFKLAGYKVIGICPDDEFSTLLSEEGFDIIHLRHLSRKGLNPINEYLLYKELKDLYKRIKPNYILHYTIKPNIYGTLAAKNINCVNISNITGLGYSFTKKGMVNKIVKALYKNALKYSNAIVFQNPQDKSIFISEDIAPKNISYICNGSGIDVKKYSSSIDLNEVDEHNENVHKFLEIADKKNSIKFLLIARLLKDKGVLEFIETANIIQQQYPQAHFFIAGNIDDGNPASLTETELQELVIKNPNITYLNYLYDTRWAIQLCDCVVLPSYREGMPRVILEAYAMGKPCIVSDAPGCKEIIENSQAGIMVKTKDVQSLVNGVETFINMPANTKLAMSLKARELAETKYSDKVIFQFYKSLIEKLDNY